MTRNDALKTSLSDVPSPEECWLCGNRSTRCTVRGTPPAELTPAHFAITDAHYGSTLSIYRCDECGFRFCPEAGDVTGYYEALQDEEYERTREERALQARGLLKRMRPYASAGSLLDIGAGSGIFVEQALQQGYQAQGIEPSAWLAQQARKRGLPVTEGIFPQVPGDRYDVIALIDVLEHVHTPLALLSSIAAHLQPGGIAAIVTPDAGSLAARLMGRKWWHYRVAHIGYFDKKTLTLALRKAGLTPVSWQRPSWVFPLDYLLGRLSQYLPFIKKAAQWRFACRVTIPLNLYDSWLVIARKDV